MDSLLSDVFWRLVRYTLTVPMLVTAGYLPAGFSARNHYSSTYKTLIYQPEKNKFHSMTFLTGGTRLSLSQARKLAGYIGASGGYIQGNVAKGALGAWTEKLSAFGGFNPGEGHVVMAGFYANGAVVNDYLYRKAVPGHPELNTMSTSLDMGGNDVNHAGTLNVENVSATGKVTSADIVEGKYFYPGKEVIAGRGCSQNGMIARDDTGQSLSCVNRVWAKSSSVPVGTIAIWGAINIPYGWLECNGQSFNTSVYPELAKYYPSGNVPDFRGVFLRGLDRGVGRDTDSGRRVLSYQEDTLQNHTHIAGTETGYWDNVPTTPTRNTLGDAHIRMYNDRTGDVNTQWGGARISSETRPKNTAVLYIIKAE